MFQFCLVFTKVCLPEITLFSGHYYPPEVIQFHADHPFIFYIKVKDLIVFAGRVKQPSYN
jgi:serine protease inhibitor